MAYFIKTPCTDPYANLALEECLLEGFAPEAPVLYLWQNARTVVIGRNQNAWKECRTDLLEQEGGRLARRSSGGGAVYHDLGNLNFTFLLPREQYDLHRQLSVIQQAASAFGIETAFTGRNDLVTVKTGAKFSGNAFQFTQKAALHHGTLLVDADMGLMGRYLAPSQAKLASKGVDSVRARVTNLREENPAVTVDGLGEAVYAAFSSLYGHTVPLTEKDLDAARLVLLTEKYSSWDWRLGKNPRFDLCFHARFDWGTAELLLSHGKGTVTDARLFTDAMNPELPALVQTLLHGCRFDLTEMGRRLVGSDSPEAKTLGAWLEIQTL